MKQRRRLTLLFPLRADALAACNYLPQSREKIIAALFKALNSTNSELQEAGEACMRKVGLKYPFPPTISFILALSLPTHPPHLCPAITNDFCQGKSIQDGVWCGARLRVK